MTEIKNIKAIGEYVVLKMVVSESDGDMYKQNKSGLLLPNEDTSNTSKTPGGELKLEYALIHEIGPKVETPDFKVGDKVVFNEYDIKYVGSKENMYGIIKSSSVMAVYNTV